MVTTSSGLGSKATNSQTTRQTAVLKSMQGGHRRNQLRVDRKETNTHEKSWFTIFKPVNFQPVLFAHMTSECYLQFAYLAFFCWHRHSQKYSVSKFTSTERVERLARLGQVAMQYFWRLQSNVPYGPQLSYAESPCPFHVSAHIHIYIYLFIYLFTYVYICF